MLGKRKSAGLLILLSLLLLVSACSPSSSGEAPARNGTNEAGETGEAGDAGEQALDEYQISIVFINRDYPEKDQVEEKINEMTKEKFNATVDFTMIDWGAWSQQTTLMLAGNEKVDLMTTSNTLFNYTTQVAQGRFLPLDELLQEHGQGILEVMAPEYLDAARVDGKIYGIPSLRDMAVSYGFMMRTDLLEKYKIDAASIKTLDDVENVFETIKQNEPNVTPFVASIGSSTPIELLYPAYFDLMGDSLGVLPWSSEELKVVNMYETQEYKDLLTRVRRWYENGYIAKDAPTTTENGATLIGAGTAFSSASNTKPGYEIQTEDATGVDMTQVDLFPPVYTTGTVTSFMLSIPIGSKDPERAMKFLNLLYTDPDIKNLMDHGIEGRHYEKTADNIVNFIGGQNATNVGYYTAGWQLGNQLISYIRHGNEADLWEQTKAFNEKATPSKALGFNYNSEKLKTQVAAVQNVVSRYKMSLETGSVDPEEVLPQFIEEMKAAGIDDIIAEKQRQLDEWAASKSSK